MRGTEEHRTTDSPLAATLGRVAAGEIGDDGIRLSDHPGVLDEPGWVSTERLSSDAGLLTEVLTRLERGYGTDDRAYSGTTLLRGHLWRVLVPAVAALLSERRLPDLGARNVALRFDEGGFAQGLAFVGPRFAALADDPEAGHPDSVVLPSEDAFLGWLREALAGGHLPILIPALRGLRMRRGTRTMWRAAADVCAEAFLFVGQGLGREAEAIGFAEGLLAGPAPLSAPTNYYVLEHDGGARTTRVRNACCLYYKVGDGPCFTCPRVTDEERLRLLAEE